MVNFKTYLFLLAMVPALFSCRFFEDTFYSEIDADTYSDYKPVDTLLQKNGLLITEVVEENDIVRRLVQKNSRYFKLDYDAYLENDSIIIVYEPAYIYDDEGEFRKNGVWFYSEKTVRPDEYLPVISHPSVSYAVDSLPPDYKPQELPTAEGIYFYENNRLELASKEQSEEGFKAIGKNGFYFVPNKGRLFTRYNINQIE